MDDVCATETGFGALLTPEEEGKKNELIIKLSKINVKNAMANNEIVRKEYDEGIESGNVVKKEGLQTKDNEDWSPNAISSLLNAWSVHYRIGTECSQLDREQFWKKISEEVNGCSRNSSKHKDLEQCKLKFKAMKGRYNREKMAKKFNSNESNSWEWYNTMDTLFSGIPCSMNSLMNTKNIKEGVDIVNNTPNLITYYDVKDKHIEKHIVEENIPIKTLFLDAKGKIYNTDNDKSIDKSFVEGQNIIQCHSFSTPTSPNSLRNFIKVKWRDSDSSPVNLIDKYREEAFEASVLNSKPSNYQDKERNFFLVNEIKEKLMFGEHIPSNYNKTILDKKGKGTLTPYDSCSDNSMGYNGNDVMGQGSATSSPVVFMTSQTEHKGNKCDERSSLSHNNCEDQHMDRFSVMELSSSIDCNYKHTRVKKITNKNCGNEKKDFSKEESSSVGEHKFHASDNSRRHNENLATNIERGTEQMAVSTARADSEAHSAKVFSSGSPMASVTSQSGSSYSRKRRKILQLSSSYKYERENRSTRTLITTLMRASSNVPQLKRSIKSLSRVSHAHEPNLMTALMTFGAMIQQLEKNQIALTERFLNKQLTTLNDFVKTLKHNDQVREATLIGLVLRFLLSLFLIGIILYGTSTPTLSWMPISFQSNNWFGKSNDDYFSQLVWIGCFVVVLLTQLLWTSFKRRPITPLYC